MAKETAGEPVARSPGGSEAILAQGHPGKRPLPSKVVVRIGVTGSPAIPDAHVAGISDRVRIVLHRIKGAADCAAAHWPSQLGSAEAALRLISPLGEGADRIVATVAAEFAADLQCPLPAPTDEYKETFSDDDSRRFFEQQIERATAILELDGRLTPGAVQSFETEESYANARDVVLQNSDLLLAIFSPGDNRPFGDPAEVVERALNLGHIIVWIDPEETTTCGPLKELGSEEFHDLRRRPRADFRSGLKAKLGTMDDLARALSSSLDLLGENVARANEPHRMEGAGAGVQPVREESRQLNLINEFLNEIERKPRRWWRLFSGAWSFLIWNSLPEPKEPTGRPAKTRSGWWGTVLRNLAILGSLVLHSLGRPLRWLRGRPRSTRGNIPARIQSTVQRYERYRDPVRKLAGHYAGLHRSSFLTIAILGILAVALALVSWVESSRGSGHDEAVSSAVTEAPVSAEAVGSGAGALERVLAFSVTAVRHEPWIAGELLLLLGMVLLYSMHTLGKWHERSLDYRLLTERLRHMSALALLGRSVPLFPYTLVQYSQFDPRETWVERYFRAVVREVGLCLGTTRPASGTPNVAPLHLEPTYLNECREYFRTNWIGEQITYHEKTKLRAETFHLAVELLVVAFLVCAIVVCILHLVRFEGPENPWLYFWAVYLPALGAALHSIASQAEVARLTHRSDAMIEELRAISKELDFRPAGFTSAQLAEIADKAAGILLCEVGEWRVLFQTHPPHRPG
jgi:hypothetical protein